MVKLGKWPADEGHSGSVLFLVVSLGVQFYMYGCFAIVCFCKRIRKYEHVGNNM